MGTCSTGTRDLTSGHPNLWCQNLWGHFLCLGFAACLPTAWHYCNPLTEQFSAQSYRSNLLFSERVPAWWSTVINRWWTKTSKAFWSILPNYRWIITLQWSWRWNACERGSKCGRGQAVTAVFLSIDQTLMDMLRSDLWWPFTEFQVSVEIQ